MRATGIVLAAVLAAGTAAADDLSYQAGMSIDHPLGCLMAYPADKTGDHHSATRILEACVAKGNVWSMIWLSMLYENGQGVPRDLAKAADLMRRGAAMHDEAGYGTLARYHWGVALVEGRGVARDEQSGLHWLRLAAAEGLKDAEDFLRSHGDRLPGG